jgi:small subunit ribosomal protein S17e
VDRIKRISREILHDYKDDFGVDFIENKKILNKISIIRSKVLKNELAGYITKFIKREIREKTENEKKILSQSKEHVEEVETKTLNENQSNEKNQEQTNEENNASTEQQKTP